jgi:deoxyribodipyrimidine photo-lyase
VLDEHFLRPASARRTPFRIQFLLESIASLAANLEHAGSRLIVVGGRSVESSRSSRALEGGSRASRRAGWRPWDATARPARGRELHVPLELFDTETLVRPDRCAPAVANRSRCSAPSRAPFDRDVEVARRCRRPANFRRCPRCEDAGHAPALARVARICTHNRRCRRAANAGAARLKSWLAGDAKDYDELRDRMDLPGSSACPPISSSARSRAYRVARGR